MPEGASPGNTLGIHPLKYSTGPPDFSRFAQHPPLAAFCDFKNKENIKRTILSLHENYQALMTPQEHSTWVAFFNGIPQGVAEVPPEKLPNFFFPTGTYPALGEAPPAEDRSTEGPATTFQTPRSQFDVDDRLPVPVITDSSWMRLQRQRATDSLLRGKDLT